MMPVDNAVAGMFASANRVALDVAREEGRREILKEIAAINCEQYAPGGWECGFCEGQNSHAPNCLWLRAQAVQDK